MNNIILYIAKPNEEIKYYFTSVLEAYNLKKIESNYFSLSVDDIDSAIESISAASQEFYLDVSCYIEEIELPIEYKDYIYLFLKEKQNGIYRLKDIIEDAVLKNDVTFKNEIKKYFSHKLSNEVIETALVFIETGNSIKASKELYIHRNTLNYRLDTVKKITSLDLKNFIDQFAFYGLFKS